MRVPGITSELQRQRRRRSGGAARVVQRGLSIGQKQSGYSCQNLRMNAKSKRAFLGKKGATHSIGKVTRRIHHTCWWKWSWGCTSRAWGPGQDWLLDLGHDASRSLHLLPDIIYQACEPEFWMQEKLKGGKTRIRKEHACSRRKSGMDHATFPLGSRFCFLKGGNLFIIIHTVNKWNY